MRTIYAKFLLIIFSTIISFSINAQIYSTSSGGPWDSTWTWIGGTVPSSLYDVVINGPVVTANAACKNLNITSSGSLKNTYYSYTLTVSGNITNNGTITNNVNQLYINVGGDVTNNGIWDNQYVTLTGTTPHTITSLNNHPFSVYQFQNTGSGEMFINSFAYFEDVQIHLGNLNLNIATNSTLKIHDGYLYQARIIGSGSSSKVVGEGALGSYSPVFNTVSFTDISIEGNTEFNANCSMHGNNTNNGFMQNAYYGYTIEIYDNFINNGTIQNYVNTLTISLYGDFINNGTITNSAINLYADFDQSITEQNNHAFNMSYFTSFKPSGKTNFLTDIDFLNCIVNMQNDTIIVPENSTLTINGGNINNAIIYAGNNMDKDFKLNMNETSYINNCHVYNPEILNKVKVKNNNFYGDIIVTDTLENDYYGYYINIHGDIINNGVIQNFINNLDLNIEGNIINNGIWNNHYISLTGTGSHNIDCLNNHAFSVFRFQNTGSGETFINSFAYFENVQIHLNNLNLNIAANSTLKIHDGYLYQANVLGAGSSSKIVGDGVLGSNSPAFNTVSFTDINIEGNTEFNANCSIHGNTVNNGFMQNEYYNYAIEIYDNFINNGTIRNYVNTFTIKSYGNITNNGIMTNHAIDFYGTTDQTISLQAGNTFAMTYFTSFKPSGQIIATTDLNFDNVNINLDHDTLKVPENSTISVSNNRIYRANILASTGRFNLFMENEAYLIESNLHDVTLTGTTDCNNANHFYGTTINDGILENDYYSYVLVLHGDITNNGTIQNFINTLTLQLYGNIENNNNWNNQAIDFYGTTDQAISLASGEVFSPSYFSSYKPTGNLVALTDLSFDNVNINLQNDTLILLENGNLNLSGNRLFQSNLKAENGRFNLFMENEAYLHNSNFTDVTLTGITDCHDGNTFYGTTINEGIFENDYYQHWVTIAGDFVNHNIVQNLVNYLLLDIKGNIVNDGSWTNYYTLMNGTVDQTILIKNGNAMSGQMRFFSDIDTSPFQWYWDSWAITNPPYPQPAIFNGYTSNTLIFLNSIDHNRVGTYYCSTGGGNSRNITIEECFSIEEYSPLTLNFGVQDIAPEQETLFTYLKNTGDCDLNIDSLFFLGLDAPYSTSDAFLTDINLLSGDSIAIPVYFDKDNAEGIYDDVLKISHFNTEAPDLSTGLVAYYPFNGNANDESGTGNNGIIHGAIPTIDRFGNPNSAYFFDGTDDYIEIADSPSLRPTNITLSGWFNFYTVSADIRALIGKTIGSEWRDSYTIWRQSTLKGATGTPSAWDELAYNHPTNQGEWYHIAYTYDDANNTHSLYINGNIVKSEANTVSIGYDTHPLLIGADVENESLAYFFHGLIDEVRIYNRALSDYEVKGLYYLDTETEIAIHAQLVKPAITVDFEADKTLAETNELIQFTDLTTGDPISWTWDFGDGTTSVDQNPSHVYLTTGTYTVSLIANNYANSDTLTKADYIIIENCNTSMTVLPNPIDFGIVNIATTEDTLYSWVKNTGSCNLSLESLGGLAAPYSIDATGLIGTDISPGDSIVLPIILDRDVAADTYIDTLLIDGNTEPEMNFEDGLIAYYPFNGNANDESGNGHDGTIYGSPQLTYDRFGNANAAYDFGGVDDYIALGSWFTYQDFTISVWVNQDTLLYSYVDIIDNSHTGSRNWVIQKNYNEATYHFGSAPQGSSYFSVPNHTWRHIVCIKDGATIRTFTDGILSDEVTGSTDVLNYAYQNLFIARWGSGGRYFDGRIDDIRMYDRAITEEEVEALYYEGTEEGGIAQLIVQAELVHPSIILDLTAFIEGADNDYEMRTDLNALNLLPLNQPYNMAPWNYTGTETVTSIPNTDVVDWVLVEIRDAVDAANANSTTKIGEKAALLLNDGSIVDLDGSSEVDFGNLALQHNLFVKVYHRNHISVLSANALVLNGGIYTYNFSTSVAQAFQSNQKLLFGKAVMIGGDANADDDINMTDKIIWNGKAGTSTYQSSDFNLDGQTDNRDKNDILLDNLE